MNVRVRAFTAAVLLTLLPSGVVAAQPARTAAQGSVPPEMRYPATTSVDLGQATLFMQSDRQEPLAGVQLFVSAGLNRETLADNGLAALVAECILHTPVQTPLGSLPLRDAVIAEGGSISYEVESLYTRFYVESQPDRLPVLLGFLGSALAAPSFGSPTLAAAKADLTTKIEAAQNNPVTVGIGMFKQSYFVGGAGLPSLGTQANVAGFDTARLQEFFQATYRRGGTTVTAVGDVTPQMTAATKLLVDALPPGTVEPVSIQVKPLADGTHRIITHRDIGAPWLVLGFAAPSPGDPDFGPMLVIEALLSNVFERSSATTLPAIERSIGALYLYDDQPSSMVVYVNGSEIEPTTALRELLAVVDSLTAHPLRDDILARYKSSAAGAFVTDVLSLDDRSWSIGNFVEQGVGPDYPNTVLAALASTTGDDVMRVAKKYLGKYTVAIVLPRDSGER
jgi:predicted Zn-dependent peptidase